MNKLVCALAAIVCTTVPVVAHADVIEGVNRIRQRGCDGKAGVKVPLRTSRGLHEVAREWSKGGRLHHALARTDYRSVNSASMSIEDARDESSVLKMLEASYCNIIVDPLFTQIGIFQRGHDVWLVVATPFETPAAGDAKQVSARVLELVNEARAKPRRCGRSSFAAAAPLKLSALLARAALVHAKDMTATERLEHQGSDGSRPGDRVSRTGYRWRTVSENVAVGAPDADAVVHGWLESPGHCANIMGAQYSEMGVAYFVDSRSKGGIYWAQVFASPR